MKNNKICINLFLIFFLVVLSSCSNAKKIKNDFTNWYAININSDELMLLPENKLSQNIIKNNDDIKRYYDDIYMYKYLLSDGTERTLYFSDNDGRTIIDFGEEGFRCYRGSDYLWAVEQYKAGDYYCLNDKPLDNQCFQILFVGYVEGIKIN